MLDENRRARAEHRAEKKESFRWAMAYVVGLTFRNELEPYTVNHEKGSVFEKVPGHTVTPAEQEVDLAIKIADWLMDS